MKKPINSIEDVIFWTAKECGVSEDVVNNVYKNLWESVRYYFINPKGEIMLNTFIKFQLSEKKLYNIIKKGRLMEEDISYYEELFQLRTGETFDERNESIKQRKEKWQKTNQERESA